MATRKKPARKSVNTLKKTTRPVRKLAAKKSVAKKVPARKAETGKAAKKPIAKKTVAKKVLMKKPLAKKSVAKKSVAKKSAVPMLVAKSAGLVGNAPTMKQTAPPKSGIGKPKIEPAVKPAVARQTAKSMPSMPPRPPRARRKITPEQALSNTRALLEAKHEKIRQPANYPTVDAVHPHAHGSHEGDAAQPETAPTERIAEAIEGHVLATERGDQSKRGKR